MAILQVQELTHIYGQGTPFVHTALDHVSLSIEKGEMVGVIGHTGSGKSTLIQHLNGLLRPTSGRVLLDGKDIWGEKYPRRQARFRVGLVFQYPEYQLFEETVRKDIAFGPKNMGLEEGEIARRVEAAMAAVGLDPKLGDKSPFELSGGQKRRVAIAGVLAMRPNVLVLDEPAAGLDPRGRREMLALVRDYHARGGVTVIMVSHSMDDVARMCSRIIVMNHGKVAFDAPPAQVFAHGDELAAMGLGIPACAQLANRLREKGFEIPSGMFEMEKLAGAIAACLGAEGEDCHA